MEIVKAAEKDAKEILPIILKEFSYAGISGEKMRKKMHSKRFRVFKAVEKGKIVGFLELEKLNPVAARINGISIKPEYRGNGFGKKLLEFAIGFLKKKGIKQAILLVKQSNKEAKKLYAEAGFRFMRVLENEIDNETIEELELNFEQEPEENLSYVG